ncbi:hypothetical protein [Paenibacillus gansuensis]|uniref:Uncharacterized protein n=1 Tax=Paenibacillus gansuensis TaxID=306542 RepID=A0ABW5P763_9BACL
MKTELPHLEDSSLTIYIRPVNLTRFQNEDELREKAIEWGLMTANAKTKSQYWYKGREYKRLCTLVGYDHPLTCVVEFQDGNLHNVHYAYLKEMQAAGFSAGPKVVQQDSDEADAGEDSEASAANAEADGADSQLASGGQAGAAAVSSGAGTEQPEEAEEAQSEEPKQAAKPAAKAAKAPKAPKAPKIVLPEEKMAASATVHEFTTKYNHFNDSEDEVVVYSDVKITKPDEEQVELDFAWSSYSGTLKKQELEAGDRITFEAKFADKKLNKEVRFKINNPSKIQKQ